MKNVVITGTGRGLGRALFDALYERTGVRLLCISRTVPAYQRRLSRRDPARVQVTRCDLGRCFAAGRVRRALRAFLANRPSEVVLVNNAGVVHPIGPVGRLDDRALREAVLVNVLSPMRLANEIARAAGPLKARVRVVNISSGAARRPIPGWAVYCATKAAASMFCDTMALRHGAGAQAHAVSVDPGVMDTGMQRAIRSASQARFPLRQYFIGLKKSCKLADPRETAVRIVREFFS